MNGLQAGFLTEDSIWTKVIFFHCCDHGRLQEMPELGLGKGSVRLMVFEDRNCARG